MRIQLDWHRGISWPLAVILTLMSIDGLAGAEAQPTLEIKKFSVNEVSLVAEIADDSHERLRGLSFRKKLEPNTGMLFVYPQEQKLLFTMQDASIPLSIAFLDKDMNILEILAMTPFTKGPYPSAKPARFALEMSQGWFEQNGIKPGDKLREAQ